VPQVVTIAANGLVYVNIGLARGTPPPNGSTTVNTFNDLNGDGYKENNEPNLANIKVFLDLNNNGALDTGEPLGLTNSSGLYTFNNLSSVPIYHVRVIGSGGYVPSGAGELDVIAANNQFSLGLYQPQTINGIVFNDANHNGGDDNQEGLVGWQVYVDENKNGKLDAGEPVATTNNSGGFSIPNVAPGIYSVRAVLPMGWSPESGNGSYVEVVTSGQTPYSLFMSYLSSAGSISGSVFIDSNGNGKLDAAESPAQNWVVYDDVNNNLKLDAGDIQALTDGMGVYRLLQVPLGTAHVRTRLPSGWVQTNSPTTTVKVVSGMTSTGPTFGVRVPKAGSISGRVFQDNNGNGIYDPQDGGVNDCTVYIDSNNDGKFDSGDYSALTESSGQFAINYIPAGTYVLHEIVGTNFQAEGPTSKKVIVQTNQTTTANFGQFWPSGIRGTVYNDLNGNTSFDTGEPVLPHIRVFLDLNENGVLDAGEPSVLSDTMGAFQFTNIKPGVYRVSQQAPPKGMVFLSPVNGHIDLTIGSSGTWVTNLGDAKITTPVSFTGTVYNDLNLDAKQQINEAGLKGFEFYVDYNNNSVLDPGEPTAFSNSAGVYTFNKIPTGRYLVRPIVPALWRLDGFVAWFATSDAKNVTGLNFAMTQMAWLGGRVYADFNGNGVFDSYESGLSGWTVYIDANNNGKLDAGEQTNMTNSVGQFNFLNGVAPGTYTVRIVQKSGYTLRTPASFTVTLAKGDSARERFGEQAASA
jgi:serine-aspartate repeat-containing protein C/D/E